MGYRIETNGPMVNNAKVYFDEIDISRDVRSIEIIMEAGDSVKAIITVSPSEINGKPVWGI